MKNIRERKVEVLVKDKKIVYDEYYVVDDNGEEIFDRDIEIENDERLYDIYKRESNLLTNEEIKKIRKKYNLTQKDYAAVIGVGEVTVHRFEKGAIQTEAVDSIMRLSNDPNNMCSLLIQNKDRVSKDIYNRLLERIKELINMKKHRIVDISELDKNILEFEEESAVDIANKIIEIYNNKIDAISKKYDIEPSYITNLKLQKLLYFVQAICLLVFDKGAFDEKIMSWSYGPVVDEVYQVYKNKCSKEIATINKSKKISNGLEEIIYRVIDGYGNMEATKLIDFTHEERPWKDTDINMEITKNKILDYYKEVYDLI